MEIFSIERKRPYTKCYIPSKIILRDMLGIGLFWAIWEAGWYIETIHGRGGEALQVYRRKFH